MHILTSKAGWMKHAGVHGTMLVTIASLVLTFGCESNHDDKGTPAQAQSVGGTWSGSGTVTQNGQTATASTTLVLSQDGTQVSGTWDGYAVTGTFDGATLNLTVTPFSQSGVNFTGTGTATVSGNSMQGSVSLTGKKGTATVTISAQFNATRTSGQALEFPPASGALGQEMVKQLLGR